ncbi:OLC1v1015512C1 [Oldenlandia corymbosa var. corymbosa]|uniref:OLC1v1015512C1 n=1 Tax=Oldenlandia corymbosa var. corymbosa TaxID=529605 RepID=A0AAV1E3G5_OLDCO|nr:OLC1v1015512C1 [Oldenlandia corymbosa var. corymbosa]
MLFLALRHCEEVDQGASRLFTIMNMIQSHLEEEGQRFELIDSLQLPLLRSEQSLCTLTEKIEDCRSEVKQNCSILMNYQLKSKEPATSDEVLGLINLMVQNLSDLAVLRREMMVGPQKELMKSLQKELQFMRCFVAFTATRCFDSQKFKDILSEIQAWANHIACVSYLIWVEGMDQDTASGICTRLSELLPEKAGKCLVVLKVSKSDTCLLAELITSFVDFLLKYLHTDIENHLESIQEGLAILLSFLLDSPQDYPKDRTLILAQADVSVSNAITWFFSRHRVKRESDWISLLSGFHEKISIIKEEVRMFCIQIPDVCEFKFLRPDGKRYFDFILENLQKMMKRRDDFNPLVERKIETVMREIEHLMPLLLDVTLMEGRTDHLDPTGLSVRVINMAYKAEYVIDLCSLMDTPIWYSMVCLSVVSAEIKNTKIEIENQLQDGFRLYPSAENARNALRRQATTSLVDDVVLGFEDQETNIIDHLLGGSEKLQIIGIFGMPGQAFAWTCVSQEYKPRDLLCDILSNITVVTDREVSNMSDEDLSERVRNCLMGRQYLIVLDDTWDAGVWNDLRLSFPDQNNGSRVLFTSRNKLAGHGKLKFISHPLRRFSDNESVELLLKKVFGKDDCPQDLLQISMSIAKQCKGLPLLIVLVAGPTSPKPDALSSVYSLSFISRSKRMYPINSRIFKIFRLLKVLDFGSIMLNSSFPECITLMIHLRYLSISGKITYIPPSIADLWNLETLIVQGEIFHAVHLPDTFWNMKSLRHVKVSEVACILFPKTFGKVNEPTQLNNLQSFSLVTLQDAYQDSKILLRRLPRLRKLSCRYSQAADFQYKIPYQLPIFVSLGELETLSIIHSTCDFVGGSGYASYSYLTPPFPVISTRTFPQTLKKLSLSKFCLSRRALSTIGRLANLAVLKLRRMAFEIFTWKVEDEEFPKLQFLELSTSTIEEWDAPDDDPFPRLERLVLKDCKSLKCIPSGFANIYSLKVIELHSCSINVKDSARKIVAEQRDMGNHDLKLVSL